jgi:hypothetical protein
MQENSFRNRTCKLAFKLLEIVKKCLGKVLKGVTVISRFSGIGSSSGGGSGRGGGAPVTSGTGRDRERFPFAKDGDGSNQDGQVSVSLVSFGACDDFSPCGIFLSLRCCHCKV